MCPLFPHVRPLCILPRFILESVLPDQENGSGGHLTPAARAWLPEGVMGKRLPCPHSPARRILSVLSIEKWHHKIKCMWVKKNIRKMFHQAAYSQTDPFLFVVFVGVLKFVT